VLAATVAVEEVLPETVWRELRALRIPVEGEALPKGTQAAVLVALVAPVS
jgi:hypothetical protein